MGYWEPDYVPKDTDIIALFRVTPQDGVDLIEAGRRWGRILRRDLDRGVTDGSCGRRRYRARVIPRRSGAEIHGAIFRLNIALTISTCSRMDRSQLSASIIGNVFGFKRRLKALRSKTWLLVAYVKTFRARDGIVVERERMDKLRPPRCWVICKPKLGLWRTMVACLM